MLKCHLCQTRAPLGGGAFIGPAKRSLDGIAPEGARLQASFDFGLYALGCFRARRWAALG